MQGEEPMRRLAVAVLVIALVAGGAIWLYRPDFVQAFLDHLINWDFVAQNLAQAK